RTRRAAPPLPRTSFCDKSGAPRNSPRASSHLVTLGMVAMQSPVFAQIGALGQVDLPVAGTVYNVNGILGQNGIVGIKTGSGLNTGANFLFAAKATVDGHEIVIYGCLMGQPSLAAAFAGAQRLIGAMSPVLHVR